MKAATRNRKHSRSTVLGKKNGLRLHISESREGPVGEEGDLRPWNVDGTKTKKGAVTKPAFGVRVGVASGVICSVTPRECCTLQTSLSGTCPPNSAVITLLNK